MSQQMEFLGKSVLITGGLGFIGSNMARRLLEAGARVTLVDSLIPQYGGNPFNIKDLAGKVEVNISDVRDQHSIECLVRGKHYLFNLAGQTSHMDSMEDPFTDLQINSLAQLSILETCRRHNPDIKIVFASTRQIYGRPEYLPVDEKHPLRPVDVNGINKLAGEQYHRLYNDVYGIRTCSLRLTNTYGPRMRIRDARQTFVGLWIRRAIEGRAFDVWGGDQRRDFIYVDDAVDAFLKAAESDRADGQVFNLGGREVISLRQLAAMLTDLTSTPHVTIPFPENRKAIDIGDYYSDDLKVRSELGWEPVIGLEIGLRRTIAYFRENLDRYV